MEDPVWSKKDFEKARPASELPAGIAARFSAHARNPDRAEVNPCSIRLSAEVVERLQGDRTRWQTRIDEALKKGRGVVGEGSSLVSGSAWRAHGRSVCAVGERVAVKDGDLER